MTFSPPSRSPASRNDMVGTIRFVLTKFLQNGIDDMLPARVISFDRATNRAKVQPLIKIVNTSNQQIQRAQIASVPVLQLGGGGFVLSFPLNPGDIGWIKANDRDISLFLQGYNSAPPNTQRFHSFEDAIFIPDSMMKGVTIDPLDEDAVTLQNLDGTVKIALHSDSITITAPTMTVTAGELNVTGNINADGDILCNNGTGTTISLHEHRHSGVQTGGGNTGNPIV